MDPFKIGFSEKFNSPLKGREIISPVQGIILKEFDLAQPAVEVKLADGTKKILAVSDIQLKPLEDGENISEISL